MDNGVNLDQPKPIVHSSSKNGSSLMIILIAVVVIIGIGIAAFWVMGKNGTKETAPTTTTQTETSGETASLESDLNSLQIEEVSADFSGVEQDLKGL